MTQRLDLNLFLESIIAFHLSNYVESDLQERGGYIVVGPPGAFKSTMVQMLDTFADVLPLSDINAQALNKLKNRMATGAIKTLVLPELMKLYERAEHTSSNVEGTIRALVSEGFSSASFEDPTIQRLKARAMVIGATTPDVYEAHAENWRKTGFSRRFIWSLVTVDTSAIEQWLVKGKTIPLRTHPVPNTSGTIEDTTTESDRRHLLALLKYQPEPHMAQQNMLRRVLSAWRWWYQSIHRNKRSAMTSLTTWAATLGKSGAQIHLPKEMR